MRVCEDWEYKGFFTSDPISKIAMIFSRLANYVTMQVHACREEKVMATGGEKQLDEHDRGSNQSKMCFVFCGASPYFF